MSAIYGFCEVCGASRTAMIVLTPNGVRNSAVGLVCSADPQHGPDGIDSRNDETTPSTNPRGVTP